MAYHALSSHFAYFFTRINPSLSFERRAASEYSAIKGLIEDPYGAARELSPRCFLQGSYRQETAIYTINDVDIVALCELWYPGTGGVSSRSWTRDQIFATIAAPLLNDRRYRDKVRYTSTSMCIKVELDIRVEILPVVYKQGNTDFEKEPFCLYRPENHRWEDGYARYHQYHLSHKNTDQRTGGNYKPAIKVLKHLRSKYELDAVSFHIECLLHSLPDALFGGSPADYIVKVLGAIATVSADEWYRKAIQTPCGDRYLFTELEWNLESWRTFHKALVVWAQCAALASQEQDRNRAIELWQLLLGQEFFPKQVNI